jgi:RimJ/RimL family protein N-acetyltransferase
MTEGPLLVTERLELWRPAKGDREALLAIVSDPETNRFLGRGHDAADHFQRFGRNAGSWFLYGYGACTVRLRNTTEIVGNCGVFHTWRGLGEDFDDKPEAGWIIRADQTGQGFAYEAMAASIAWFDREYGPQPIVCMISHDNARSLRLAERLGFRPLRDAVLPDGDGVALLVRRAP